MSVKFPQPPQLYISTGTSRASRNFVSNVDLNVWWGCRMFGVIFCVNKWNWRWLYIPRDPLTMVTYDLVSAWVSFKAITWASEIQNSQLSKYVPICSVNTSCHSYWQVTNISWLSNLNLAWSSMICSSLPNSGPADRREAQWETGMDGPHFIPFFPSSP